MRRYACQTTVPVEKSRAEIEQIACRYGADKFLSGWTTDEAVIGFRIQQLYVRFVLPIPKKTDPRFAFKKDRWGFERKRSEAAASKEWDQETRRRWRALLLAIKAKLEAVESGISTIENEFLAFTVLANDQTFGQWIQPHLEQLRTQREPSLPRLMAPVTLEAEVIEAEVVQETTP